MAIFLLGTTGAIALASSWSRRELTLARSELTRKAWRLALPRYQALARWRPGWGEGEVEFGLGSCLLNVGRGEEAVRVLERIPPRSAFAVLGAVLLAERHIIGGRLRAAEDALLAVRTMGGPVPPSIWKLLVSLARMEARYEEAREWMREAFEGAEEPVAVLRQLWLLDRGSVPIEGVRATLVQCRNKVPDDDRVWLGLARVAILDGRTAEAEGWLRRCTERAGARADRSLALARLDLDRSAGRAEGVGGFYAGEFGRSRNAVDTLCDLAWLARRTGRVAEERRLLECILELEPRAPDALDRSAALAALENEPSRASKLRRLKAEVDDALDRYRLKMRGPGRFTEPTDLLEMAALAEQAGRPYDARAWCSLFERVRPSDRSVTSTCDRLARRDTESACLQEALAIKTPGVAALPGQESPPRPAPDFRDDAVSSGLGFRFQGGETAIRQLPAVMSGGVGMLDYDSDGWLDVYCVQGGTFPPGPDPTPCADRLFRNLGHGRFEDVSARSGITGMAGGYGHGVAVGDYDNDGRPDLFVTRWRSYALYRNRGDGTFRDVTRDAGLGGLRGWPTSAAFADLDNDGDLDLYVCHYLAWDPDHPRLCRDPQSSAYVSCSPLDFPAEPDHVFRNEGGRFVDLTAAAGLSESEGRGLGVVITDLDGDRRVDLFVANDQTANFLYRNLGSFRFEEVGHSAGVAANAGGGYQAGMGVACGDCDGDGLPDLAVTNYFGESTTLFRNLGLGLFGDATSMVGLAVPSRNLLGFGISFLDADNDGYLDLITANGHLDSLPGTPLEMPTQLLMGDGRRFRTVEAPAGSALATRRIGRGLAVGDLDNDGRLDALIVDRRGPLTYLHNQSPGSGHHATIRLQGTSGARDAVGARVVVTAAGNRQVRWRTGGGSYLAAPDARLHFGLGMALRIDRIEVTWPSGSAQQFADLAVDRGYLIREGESEPTPLPGAAP